MRPPGSILEGAAFVLLGANPPTPSFSAYFVLAVISIQWCCRPNTFKNSQFWNEVFCKICCVGFAHEYYLPNERKIRYFLIFKIFLKKNYQRSAVTCLLSFLVLSFLEIFEMTYSLYNKVKIDVWHFGISTLGCPTIGSLFAPQANKYDILIRNWM